MRRHPELLADGLLAWSRGEDDIDVHAAAFHVARVVLLIESALAKKGT